jgi:hypothetical protein
MAYVEILLMATEYEKTCRLDHSGTLGIGGYRFPIDRENTLKVKRSI